MDRNMQQTRSIVMSKIFDQEDSDFSILTALSLRDQEIA